MMNNKPFSVAWELTRKCNGQCIYCGSNADSRLNDELDLDSSLDLIKKLSKLEIKVINILGGEVFLREDWFTILKEIKKNGMEIFLITNGTILNNDIISKLKIIDPLNISVSLDGNEEYHDKVRKGAKGCKIFMVCDKKVKVKSGEDEKKKVVKALYVFNLDHTEEI